MFLKKSPRKQNGKTYIYYSVVEAYRDELSRVRNRTILYLGNIHEEEARAHLDACKGKKLLDLSDVTVHKSCEYGASKFLDMIWKETKLDSVLDNEYLFKTKMMVINRLLDPRSKYSLVNWYKGSYFSMIKDNNEINHNKLYQTLDYLHENQEKIENKLYDNNTKQIFYDITSSYFEGKKCDISAYGYSRDHRRDRKQIVIALAINEQKIPLAVKVLKGNASDVTTVKERMIAFNNRFKASRSCVIMDRGMVSKDNIDSIINNEFEYILCLKHTKELENIIKEAEDKEYTQYKEDETLKFKEIENGEAKYIICHSRYKERVDEICDKKRKKEAAFELKEYKEKLVSKKETKEKIIEKVTEILIKNKAKKYYEIKYGERSFEYKEKSRNKSRNGIFVIKTSIKELKGEEGLSQYKNLKTIERAFREIKDFMELRPMYHYKGTRVKAHVFVCYLSYYLYAIIDKKIRGAKGTYSVERLLDELKKVNINKIQINGEAKTIITEMEEGLKSKLNSLKMKL